MTTLTWLHLSDWHQDDKNYVGRQKVRDALVDDIRERARISDCLETVDFIVFTGDIAYHGVASEYEVASEKFFRLILESADVSTDRLIIVPGNHDLEWETVKWQSKDLVRELNSPEKVDEFLTNERKRQFLLQPMTAYAEFVKNLLGENAPPDPAYSFSKNFEVNGKRISVIGLNSALSSGRNRDSEGKVIDQGFLVVGECQAYTAVNEAKEAEVLIAALHHPLSWMVEFDQHRIEETLSRNCHFILHGHQHYAQVRVSRSTAGESVMIPCGASYGRDSVSGTYSNAYNFVHLDFEQGLGRVFLREWSPKRGKWIEDIHSHDRGKFEFSLPRELGVGSPLIEPAVELGESRIVPALREWKVLHTQMQSLLDRLTPVIYSIDLAILGSRAEESIYQIEMLWHHCVPMIKEAPRKLQFEHIDGEVVVRTVLDKMNQSDMISKKIAEANIETLSDIRSIRISMNEIKQAVATALTIADRRIAELVDMLRL